ncbi:hypothetical protein KIN20_018202 [Parelaphostrongylus tenuis]|uniref:Uncharacterized protein n=1 Tax=Parelaphostrongylus tenuis TaxID=148309 RepID=A0AAD5QPC4_PARTN|nr:hypothetical protein KIN20_018202 [Parelaphostrongylus tenuis]
MYKKEKKRPTMKVERKIARKAVSEDLPHLPQKLLNEQSKYMKFIGDLSEIADSFFYTYKPAYPKTATLRADPESQLTNIS